MNIKQFIAFVQLLLVVKFVNCKKIYEIEPETKLPVDPKDIKNKYVNLINLFVGSGFEEQIDKISTYVNIDYEETVIGEIQLSGWGVECSLIEEFTKNSCVIEKEDSRQDSYDGENYNYRSIRAFVKLDKLSKFFKSEWILRARSNPTNPRNGKCLEDENQSHRKA